MAVQGDAKTRLKDWKGAAAAFEKSLSLDNSPTLGQYEGLASALVQNKQYAEAVEKLQSYESKVGNLAAKLNSNVLSPLSTYDLHGHKP